MSKTQIDVLGIGNAIVDIIDKVEDKFLEDNSLTKGHMCLIDTDEAEALYAKMGPAIESSGGSVANSMAGIASFGGKGAFIGRVANDKLGEIFAHDIKAAGVDFQTPPATDGLPTARCFVLVTPDAERTMNTYLGASVELGESQLDENLITSAKITYLEGYLFDPEEAKAAFHKAAHIAASAGRKVALSLSDGFCVDRHRAEFRALIAGGVDILFANEAEICALYETEDFDKACTEVAKECELAALTRGANGARIITKEGTTIEVPAFPVGKVEDTTGAGDLYAAGFLFGFSQGFDLEKCGQLGALAASEIISHIGARPEASLKDLAIAKGLL